MTLTPLTTELAGPDLSGLPSIIQGGMGVAISDWKLARAVAEQGQLGVVSGVALETVMARRLQDGDPGGHVRRALAAFPVPSIARRIIRTYFVMGGIGPDTSYKPVPRFDLDPPTELVETVIAANFVEVYLAKEGHSGPVGINYLRKIALPLPASCYGALLAGVDYVLMGAGSPHELPQLLRDLSNHQPTSLSIRIVGAPVDSGLDRVGFDPRASLPAELAPDRLTAPLPRPRALAIIASHEQATTMVADPETRPDGFIVERPSAGGHNAPPRGPRRVDDVGQPVYGDLDAVDIDNIIAHGLPVWLAGGAATADALTAARAVGAVGVQVGTVFAYCNESGMTDDIKRSVLGRLAAGEDVGSRSDWRVSPTGFPFRVADVPGSLSDPAVAEARTPVCDLGLLRTAFVNESGDVAYRCPAEPPKSFARKGGRPMTAEGRLCLCNGLFAAAGQPQRRADGSVEPVLVTSGSDFGPVEALVRASADVGYSAADVIRYLLGA